MVRGDALRCPDRAGIAPSCHDVEEPDLTRHPISYGKALRATLIRRSCRLTAILAIEALFHSNGPHGFHCAARSLAALHCDLGQIMDHCSVVAPWLVRRSWKAYRFCSAAALSHREATLILNSVNRVPIGPRLFHLWDVANRHGLALTLHRCILWRKFRAHHPGVTGRPIIQRPLAANGPLLARNANEAHVGGMIATVIAVCDDGIASGACILSNRNRGAGKNWR
mmetsp:Transcript_136236/g.271725  ORF Transcript_136236/g.271725 Transcript_136236/m.271725 type:complete len:225 (-) Transcript_136236:123-797(-)